MIDVEGWAEEGVICASIVSAFDVGRSFGLGDESFKTDGRNSDPDIGWVGLKNPLGNGTNVDLMANSPNLLDRWREESLQQLERAEMETGWMDGSGLSRGQFNGRIASLIRKTQVSRCEITFYAIGVAFLRLDINTDQTYASFIPGMLNCWEYAAYRPEISKIIMDASDEHISAVVSKDRDNFQNLTLRSGPEIRVSGDYNESTLFKSFTGIIQCPRGDLPTLELLLTAYGLDEDDKINFEYHGDLYFGWATCILVPRGVDDADSEVARFWECIRIAHVFQEAGESFLKMFEEELDTQVESYAGARRDSRALDELNRLRAIALAVVTLCNVERVTESAEDREYISKFIAHAKLHDTHNLLRQSIDVLYEVQSVEVQEKRSRREGLLNGVVVVLTFLTVISVSADAYNFVRENEPPIVAPRGQRLQLLLYLLTVLTLLATVLVIKGDAIRVPRRRRRIHTEGSKVRRLRVRRIGVKRRS
ncbi:hypothetical protein ACH9D2_06650 [Kocuria sp. M4R2S49]|uniref:hypothetical protein n=1 Tax=Kocuria rhizosphaericola TaxID=3376284 RepID=UPI003795337D